MKSYFVTAALALLVATQDACVAAKDLHVSVKFHHHKAHEVHAATVSHKHGKKLFHVTGSKRSFDELLSPAVRKQLQLDVWRVRRIGERSGGEDDSDDDSDDGELQLEAEIVATDAAIEKLKTKNVEIMKTVKASAHGKKSGVKVHVREKPNWKLQIKQADDEEEVDLELRVAQDRKEVQSCLYATKGYMMELQNGSLEKYTDSAFFNCFRPYDQVFEFFDALVDANSDILTKIANVSTTYEGRTIPSYKISTEKLTKKKKKKHHIFRRGDATKMKKSLYTQSLMHAREWQAGASHFFTIASLIDDLRAGDANTLKIFDEYDWYFTPVVNIDGYKYSWETDRYWRVNRHPSNGYEGVDLNRNFPPEEYFNAEPKEVDEETNPGEYPLSEPESQGIYKYVMGLPNLAGFVDVHAYSGMVLRPFSDVQEEPEEPYGSAMKKLGDAVRDAMSPKGEFQYISQPSGKLYPAYGCIDDAFFREFNFTIPTLTIEVEGTDFIAKQSTIRDVGQDVNNGLRQFTKEASKYHAFIQKLREEEA